MYTDPTTGQLTNGLAKIRYTHDAMIDLMIAEPHISQGQLAIQFGYSQAWVSTVINSDAFQARLAERKAELVDPLLVRSVDERLRAVAQRSLDRVLENLDVASPQLALDTAKFAAAALGYGARVEKNTGPVVNFVINAPAKMGNAADWANAARAEVIEATATAS